MNLLKLMSAVMLNYVEPGETVKREYIILRKLMNLVNLKESVKTNERSNAKLC